MQIVIEMDDSGAITVTADGGEPQQAGSPEEALEMVKSMLPVADAQAMWDEEAGEGEGAMPMDQDKDGM